MIYILRKHVFSYVDRNKKGPKDGAIFLLLNEVSENYILGAVGQAIQPIPESFGIGHPPQS
jgi:hypothetical protein